MPPPPCDLRVGLQGGDRSRAIRGHGFLMRPTVRSSSWQVKSRSSLGDELARREILPKRHRTDPKAPAQLPHRFWIPHSSAQLRLARTEPHRFSFLPLPIDAIISLQILGLQRISSCMNTAQEATTSNEENLTKVV
jgi:hypothetical protein